MSQHKRTKRCFPMAAVLAVILILAGVAAIAGSLWMQENEITSGAEIYEALVDQLKLPPDAKEKPDMPQNELPVVEDTVTEKTPVMPDDSEPEQTVQEQHDQIYEPAVTVVPPLTVQPTEPEQQILKPANLPESHNTTSSAAPGFTGADLAACKAANNDFAAWLQIPGTDIDYPVVLTNDVDYYLDHTFTGEESIIGCLFSLGRADYEAPSQNIAIYGHHMRRSRSTTMFQPLHEYKSASFRDAHATIHLDTLNDSRSYTVFAVINKRESDWDVSAADFASADEYQSFLNRALEWSLYDTGVSVTTDDHILTLITCDRDYNSEDGQLVVMAVQN